MSKPCTSARAAGLVEKLFDDEVSPEERREAEAHLEACVSCRSHLEFLAGITAAARERPETEPPASYWESLPRRILHRLETEPAAAEEPIRGRADRARAFRRLLAPLALAASLLVAAILGVRLFRASPWDAAPSATGSAQEASSPAPAPAVSPSLEPPAERQGSSAGGAPAASGAPSSEPASAALPPMSRDEPKVPGASQDAESAATADAVRARVESARPDGIEGERSASAPSSAPAFVASSGEGAVRAVDASPAASATASAAVTGVSASKESRDSAESNCSGLRSALASLRARSDRSDRSDRVRENEILYRLARCSLERFGREGGEALRELALADGKEFLAHESEGVRADAIRAELDHLPQARD